MEPSSAAARRIVDTTRARLASLRSSVVSRNRNRAMVEMAMDPRRRSPRTDARTAYDLDHESRRLYVELLRDLVQADVRFPGTAAIAGAAFGLTGMEMSGSTVLVAVLDGSRMPADRWVAATGRSHAGRVAERLEEDLAKLLRRSLAPPPAPPRAPDASDEPTGIPVP